MSTRFAMPVAIHIFFVQEDQILLLKRSNTGYEDGKYSVVAGHLDGDEEVREAAQREAREEAGVEIGLEDVELTSVMHRKSEEERIDYFAVVEKWSGAIQNMEPHKCSELSWHALDALPDPMIGYVKEAIGSYRRGERFLSYGF
ncbi:NUDIX domain-containing protein [Halobacillus litoralis]|uniref:NUDIX hydrolase n=1 Tax=Halobacillus litoralis TaxID=45668 RepID=UPI001CD49003|nr:NUDIX domain-containing protein [Halobacillus litoralis]MCA0970699.1 NUDIX domain-containing protein [Halobacillus litoralis]